MRALRYAFLILPFLVFACDNSEDTVDEPVDVVIAPDNPEEIKAILTSTTSKTWEVARFEIQVYGSLACRTDDSFTFNADGTYEYNGGEVLCGEEDNQRIQTGTWKLDTTANQIVFDENTPTASIATYKQISDELLKLNGEWNMLKISAELSPIQ